MGYDTNELINIHENNHQALCSFTSSNEGLIVRIDNLFVLLPHPDSDYELTSYLDWLFC